MTTGMALPTGTFVSVKVPSKAVVVMTSGLPDTSAPQVVHCCAIVSLAREVNAFTVPFGMYTSTFGTGSPTVTPAGRNLHGVPATTVPVSVVVPESQATCEVQRPVQGMLLPHTLGLVPAPHAWGATQVGPQGPIVPPQPSAARPQL